MLYGHISRYLPSGPEKKGVVHIFLWNFFPHSFRLRGTFIEYGHRLGMQTANRKLLKAAIAQILRPVVALMLRHGVLYRDFVELAKPVFFSVGQDTLEKRQSRVTSSQLSVLTGLHRKDIATFLAEGITEDDSGARSAGAAVIAEWVTNPRYLDKSGKPRPLTYAPRSGKSAPSFTALVETVSKDIRPKAHLEELLRIGLATMDDDGTVTLRKEAFLPDSDLRGKLDFFARNVGDHLAASAGNVEAKNPRHFDRSAFHDQLSDEDIRELRQMVDVHGMDLLKKVYRRAEELAAARKGKEGHGRRDNRMTFGIYLYDRGKDSDASGK